MVKSFGMIDDEPTHTLLVASGYRLVEDVWARQGRRTYIHDDDAGRSHLREMAALLRADGWLNDAMQLRAFRRPGELIEIEPGGADTSGHFLHQLNEVV